MSGSGAAPGPGSGSSPAACRFAHYFVLCGIDADSGLEPDELAETTDFIFHASFFLLAFLGSESSFFCCCC
uniref:Uncharacterized protein n=1 Tax=Ursus americanus TaxID=9643 RepID=A0A452RPM6_URSAM